MSARFIKLIPGDSPPFVPAVKLAEWLGVCVRTIGYWSARGVLPKPHKLGPRKQFYDVEEVRTALARRGDEQMPKMAE